MKKIILAVIICILLASLVVPTSALAKAKYDLEGWRDGQGKWMDGLLWTYYECNDVPYRLQVDKYDGVATDIVIEHDYYSAKGEYGVDGAKDFFIGPQTNRTATPGSITPIANGTDGGGLFHVATPPEIVEISNGWLIRYHIIVDDAPTLMGIGDFAFYWKAHCAKTNTWAIEPPPPSSGIDPKILMGSSFWSGASLHAHTSVTGRQDVPIKTPPQVANPAIQVWKKISIDKGVTWLDADTLATGPVFTYPQIVKYKFIVTNIGDVELINITLTDSNPAHDLSGIAITSPLPAGASFNGTIGTVSPYYYAELGQHVNTATATGDYGGTTYWDTDDACYTCITKP